MARHVPVLLQEVLDALAAGRGGLFVDGTFGAGGYSQAILSANRRNRIIAIDRDPDAVARDVLLGRLDAGQAAETCGVVLKVTTPSPLSTSRLRWAT